MENKILKFPEKFLWGVATASYQIEGDNSNSDWWEWEQKGKTKNLSGKACDYWNQYRDDHIILQELGVNVFRLSIEWSRIEPQEGEFSADAINHYRKILEDLKNKNIKSVVTLWHWTSPIWFQKKYGFHQKKSVEIFSAYAQKIVEELGDLIDIYVVINEPMVPLGMGFLGGVFPPGFKNPFKFFRALKNITAAYIKIYKIIHAKYPSAQVGTSFLYNWYEKENLGIINLINNLARWYRVDLLGNKIKKFQDYFGIDYYRLGRIRFDWKKIKWDARNQIYFGFVIEEDKENIMGWIASPEGIYKVLKEAYVRYKLPIYILENGIPTGTGLNDEKRIEFIRNHLAYVKKAIDEGVDVRGYFHWSLMDNYEWLYGYEPRFGLVEMDYKTLERKPRKSFYEYAKICKDNGIEK